MPDDQLLDVALAIADGGAIDWAAVLDAGDTGADVQLLAARLKQVERLMKAHESLRSDDDASGSPGPSKTLLTEAGRKLAGREPLRVRWGRLVVTGKIGSGAFGDVYVAIDPHVDREVALKLVPERETGDRASPVIDEARRLARIRHPNVLTVYGAERIDGRVGIWTEYVRGSSLADELQRRGPLTVDEATDVGIHVARALGAVHSAGLIHRDVKAQNVLRDATGRIVLSDFGTSVEAAGALDAAEARVAGTPLYLAPETLAGSHASTASDLYSLGVLLYHLVTNDFPVRGKTLDDIRRAHVARHRTTLRERRPELPSHFVDVVDRLLAADPAERSADAASVELALAGTAPHRRRPLQMLAAGAAVAAGIAAVVAGVIWATRTAADPGTPASGWTTREISEPPCVDGSVTPDGSIVCVAASPPRRVVLFNPDTGDVRTLVEPAGSEPIDAVAVSPDGTHIAYTVGPNFRRPGQAPVRRSVRMREIGTGIDRLAAELPGDASLLQLRAWHAATRQLEFYMRRADDTYALAQVDVDSGEFRTAFEFPSMPQGHATSPDGNYVTFDFQPAGTDARDIRVCAIADGTCATIVSHPADDFYPFWDPDGDLLFTSGRTGQYTLFRTRVAGLQETHAAEPIDELGQSIIRPLGFTRGGGLYYQRTSGFPDVYSLEIGGGPSGASPEPVRLRASVIGSARAAVWSPGGETLAYIEQRGPFADPGATRIVVQSSSGRAQILPIDLRFATSSLSWSPDGRLLALDAVVGDPVANPRAGLHVIDADTGGVLKSWYSAGGRSVSWLDHRTILTATTRRISAIDRMTGEVRTIWSAPADLDIVSVALSNDRAHLAIALHTKSDPDGTVLLADVTGRGERVLARGAGIVVQDWTADGREVFVLQPDESSGNSGRSRIWRVPVDGGAWMPVGLPRAGFTGVRVHPDNRRLAIGLSLTRQALWTATGLPR